jgi:hypothetical protein
VDLDSTPHYANLKTKINVEGNDLAYITERFLDLHGGSAENREKTLTKLQLLTKTI